jgi:hypothetical protein
VRGIDLIAAVGVVAEIGDLSRFQNPRELMGYLGLVPSEDTTGDRVKRGHITKAGNGRARRILVEAAWAYRHPARVSREKQPKVTAAPRRVREIAWKAQTRLCRRFRLLERKGKLRTVIATAIARWCARPANSPTLQLAARRKKPQTSIVQERGRGHGRGIPEKTVWPIIDRRPTSDPDSPRRKKMDMRYPTRASELVHRRLQFPLSLLHDSLRIQLHAGTRGEDPSIIRCA